MKDQVVVLPNLESIQDSQSITASSAACSLLTQMISAGCSRLISLDAVKSGATTRPLWCGVSVRGLTSTILTVATFERQVLDLFVSR